MEPGFFQTWIPIGNTGLRGYYPQEPENKANPHCKRTPYEQFTSHNWPVEFTKIGIYLDCLGRNASHKSLTLAKIFMDDPKGLYS